MKLSLWCKQCQQKVMITVSNCGKLGQSDDVNSVTLILQQLSN